MQITLHFSVFFEKWDWRNPDNPGIGGSETAVVETARILAKRGHDVTVYAPIPDDCEREWMGTHWRPLEETDYTREGLWLISRQPAELDHFPENHPRQTIALVAQDVDYPNWNDERWEKLDWFIALCPTHARYTQAKYPKYAHKVRQGFNGIRCDLIRRVEAEGIPERNPRRVFFGSSPDRGLPQLLSIWPRVREWVHDAELVICYGLDNIEKIIASNPPTAHWRKLAEDLKKRSSQPGVTWLGRIGQPEQYRQIMSCGLSVHMTSFTETGFISGLQEMAMGAIPIICPTWAAGDYCQHGTWIYGDPNDPLTQARFVGEIFRLMSNVELQNKIRAEMMPWARCCFNWERFVDLLENWMYGYNVQLGAQYLFAAKHSYGLGKILNVGCGDDGGQMKRFGAINTDKFAADPVTGMKHVADVIADARDFPAPFEPHSFDVLVATEMLEHYADVPDEVPAQLLKFKELLSPGGRIVISVPDDRGQGFPVTEEPPKVEGLSAATTANPENYGWHKPVPRERVERWLEESGLKAIVWEETEYPWRDVTGHALVLVPEDSDAQRTEPVVYIPQKATRSVVYTDYDPENKLADMRAKSRESVQRWMRPGDEFIVSDQPGGWAKAVNDGVKQSHGDYIYVINNDLIVEDPAWMDKMAAPNTVTAGSGSPFTLTGDLDLELTLFCVPRNVWDAVGGMDEEFQTGICFDDNDLLARIRAAGFKTAIIPIAHRHLQSKTLMAYNDPTEYERRFLLNRALFKSKHPELEPKGGWLQ